ncbi:MAG: transglycosylase SLT domain-containing protein [Hyphomicrobiaceae bacterium]|nr:transglycosylase SLT domain-containing protein [Hyphomicrobiaceae bacterium]
MGAKGVERLSKPTPPPDRPKAEPALPVPALVAAMERPDLIIEGTALDITPISTMSANIGLAAPASFLVGTEAEPPPLLPAVVSSAFLSVAVQRAAQPVPQLPVEAVAEAVAGETNRRRRRPEPSADAIKIDPKRSQRRSPSGRLSGVLNAATVAAVALGVTAVATGRYQPMTAAPVAVSVSANNSQKQQQKSQQTALATPPTAAPQVRASETRDALQVPTAPVPLPAGDAAPANESATAQLPPVQPSLPTALASVPVSVPGPAVEAQPGSPVPPTETVAAIKTPGGEADVIARFDGFIAPARDAQPKVEDAARLRDAFASMSNPQVARGLRDQLSDPVAKTMIDWALHRAGHGSAREIKAFLDQNPDWPNRDLITQRMEEQAFVAGGSAREIKAFFDNAEPKTGAGKAALASALLAEGDEAGAKNLAADAWGKGAIAATLEVGFLERFSKLLTEADHKARLDRYLIDQSRWANERADRATIARRVLPFLSEAERRKAEARIAIYLRQPNADALLAALPADAATNPVADWGFAYQLVQWNSRAGRNEAAWKILIDAPNTVADAGNLDEWWDERRGAAYSALKAGRAQTAYDLVKDPGPLGVNQQKDHAFLAGFIALRHLKNPVAAERHFRDFEVAADGPLSRGKAGYWLALTYAELKAPDKRKAALERAATNWDTFYGQAARLELDPKLTELKLQAPAIPTEAQVKAFNANRLVRAVVLARKSGLDVSISRTLLIRLSQAMETEAEQALVAHLAEAIGDTQMAVRIGKSAIARGFNLVHYAYPIHAMPQYQALRPAPETAIMLGIARQESEFNISTLSGAGARGLMQVMPITAQHVCKDYKIKCEIDRLSRDPSYNLMMASAYIGDRMDEFQGSYVLTIAGYNAGPGRARQWMKEFGDPRQPGVDPIDWINRIPFEETRDYVQKVLSNVQVYRARLGEEANALRLKSDLRRSAAATGRRASAESAQPPAATKSP